MHASDAISQTLQSAVLGHASALRVSDSALGAGPAFERALALGLDQCMTSLMAEWPSSDGELDNTWLAENLGAAFEKLRGQRLHFSADGIVSLASSHERRDKGVYYTPSALADVLADSVLSNALKSIQQPRDLEQFAILDPAAGCGSFLLAAVRASVEILHRKPGFRNTSVRELRRMIASDCVYGVDLDPVAIAATRQLLVLQTGDYEWDGDGLDAHLRVADAIASTLQDWARWFPSRVGPNGQSRFNVVLTNPPWSKVRPLRREFFAHLDDSVSAYQGTALGAYLETHFDDLVGASWDDYVTSTAAASAALRTAPGYSINRNKAGGDTDLYKYFAERCIQLLEEGGTAGMLVPSGVLRAQGSEGLRRLLIEGGRIENLVEYINKRRLFPIHSMYRFCTIAFRKGAPGGIAHAVFGQTDPSDVAGNAGTALSSAYISSTGGKSLLVSEVKGVCERDLLLRLSKSHPRFSDPSGGWDLSFHREIDMTNDAGLFLDRASAELRGFKPDADGSWSSPHESEVLLPLYEGRMVNQFNSMAKAHIRGQGRGAVWQPLLPIGAAVVPHYLVREADAISRGWLSRTRAAYCEISGHANERTVLASMISARAICGNKVPVASIGDNTLREHQAWVGLVNSFVVDWMMRRWVSTTINFFYWYNLPAPNLADLMRCEPEFIAASEELSRAERPSSPGLVADWLGRRALLRAFVDARVMALFDICEVERELVLTDFPLATATSSANHGAVGTGELVRRAHDASCAGALDFDRLEESMACSYAEAAEAYMPLEVRRLRSTD